MGTPGEIDAGWEAAVPLVAMAGGPAAPSEGDWAAREAAQSQRRRILDAMAVIVAERSLHGATVSAVVRRARVSRAVFGEQFRDLDHHCFATLLESTLDDATTLAAEAFARQLCWRAGILAGLEALLAFLDANPAVARACLLTGLAVPPPELLTSARALDRLRPLLDEVRAGLSHERQPPSTMAEATIASVLGILRRRLLSGEAPPFVGLVGELAEVVIAPYLGPSAAAEVASAGHDRARALVREAVVAPASSCELPKMLRHARAHRLRSCLRYLAEHAEASNQTIAAGIGIAHPGQVSALLARLHDAGLVLKRHGGPGRPNAWRLSAHGAEIARALDPALTRAPAPSRFR